MSSKSEKSRREKELAQAFDTHRQIVEERKRLESLRRQSSSLTNLVQLHKMMREHFVGGESAIDSPVLHS